MQKHVIVIGGRGHAKVAADIIEKSGDVVAGFLDDNKTSQLFDYKYLGTINKLESMAGDYCFIIAVGANAFRKKVAENNDVCWYTAIHPTIIIGKGVKIGACTVISAGAIVNSDVKIGKHAIINTGAIVDHDDVDRKSVV